MVQKRDVPIIFSLGFDRANSGTQTWETGWDPRYDEWQQWLLWEPIWIWAFMPNPLMRGEVARLALGWQRQMADLLVSDRLGRNLEVWRLEVRCHFREGRAIGKGDALEPFKIRATCHAGRGIYEVDATRYLTGRYQSSKARELIGSLQRSL